MTRSKGTKTPYEKVIAALMRRTRRSGEMGVLWKTLHSLGISAPHAGAYVLVVGSAIEQALQTAIESHFVVGKEAAQSIFDDNGNGPLSTFAAKIRMGYVLGIYEKIIKEELDLIRHIRNAFAHARELTDFSTPDIIEACGELFVPKHWSFGHGGEHEPAKPESKFRTSTDFLFGYLWTLEGDAPRRYQDSDFYAVTMAPARASPRKRT